MGLRVDAVLHEEVHELIAVRRVLRFDDVQVEDVTVARSDLRQVDGGRAAKPRGVPRRPLDTLVVPRVDVLQLRAEDTSVEIVEPAVEPEAVNVPLGRSMV